MLEGFENTQNYNHARIRGKAEAFLAQIGPTDFPNDPINWGDFLLSSVAFCKEEDGDTYWLLDFSEAAPDANGFIMWMWEQFKAEGIRTDIRCEW